VTIELGMHPDGKQRIPIWFFIGLLVIVYGFMVMGAGMWALFFPPAHAVALENLHADLWWSALMVVVGGFLVGMNSPW
jgi:hypothetical protein